MYNNQLKIISWHFRLKNFFNWLLTALISAKVTYDFVNDYLNVFLFAITKLQNKVYYSVVSSQI